MRFLERLFTRVYFVMKLAMLYLVLSLCGGFLLGVAPASATLLFLYKEHGLNTENYRIAPAFVYFRKQFFQTNMVAGLLLGISLALVYSIWFSSQLLPSLPILVALISQFSFLIYLLSIYGLYLKLQVYYDFSFPIALKLAASSLFLNVLAVFKWLLGTGLCLFFAWKLPLLLAVFLPVVWLLFTFDSFHPIYQEIEKRSS